MPEQWLSIPEHDLSSALGAGGHGVSMAPSAEASEKAGAAEQSQAAAAQPPQPAAQPEVPHDLPPRPVRDSGAAAAEPSAMSFEVEDGPRVAAMEEREEIIRSAGGGKK